MGKDVEEEIRKYCCDESEFCKYLTNNPEGYRRIFGEEDYNLCYDENGKIRTNTKGFAERS